MPPTFVLNAKDEVNMQHLDRFFEFYEKHLPKQIKSTHGEWEREMHGCKKKLRAYFYNCNLKKTLPKMPKLNEHFIDT